MHICCLICLFMLYIRYFPQFNILSHVVCGREALSIWFIVANSRGEFEGFASLWTTMLLVGWLLDWLSVESCGCWHPRSWGRWRENYSSFYVHGALVAWLPCHMIKQTPLSLVIRFRGSQSDIVSQMSVGNALFTIWRPVGRRGRRIGFFNLNICVIRTCKITLLAPEDR